MFNLKDNNILKFFATFSLIVMLTACSSSNDGVAIVFDPNVAPQNVQVVSGDDNTGEVQNTISWTLDPAATGYKVYVENTSGDVTESSSVVVPLAKGFNYITHSGVDVVAGTTLYYRVQALSDGESSILSDEVTGTPQESITTTNALNDVAWNGTDTLVAVGAAGVILSSPNGTADGWTDVSHASTANNSLAGVTWEIVNDQFLIVGAGGTVLTGDGTTWDPKDLSNLATAPNLEDVTWLGDRYIAVGLNGAIITSDANGSAWTALDTGIDVGTTTLKGVASNEGGNGDIIVVVGTNGTILTSIDDGVTWTEVVLSAFANEALNDISWDGSQFGVVGSNDTILTSADGVTWTSHIPGTPNITFVAATQWDSGVPTNPVLGAVGSAGTFVVSPDAVTVTGFSVPTGTNEQLSGMTWVDNVTPPYFVMVGNDGTVLTSQLQ